MDSIVSSQAHASYQEFRGLNEVDLSQSNMLAS
jgi:hypothetical protein